MKQIAGQKKHWQKLFSLLLAAMLLFTLLPAPRAAAEGATSGLSAFFRGVSEQADRFAEEWDAYVAENGDPFEDFGTAAQEAREAFGIAREEAAGALSEAWQGFTDTWQEFTGDTDWEHTEQISVDWSAFRESFRAFRQDAGRLLSDLYELYGKPAAEAWETSGAGDELRDAWSAAWQGFTEARNAFREAWLEARTAH